MRSIHQKNLHNFRRDLHNSHIFKGSKSFFFHLFEIGRSQPSDFLKLVGQMCHAAVVQLGGYFGKVEFVNIYLKRADWFAPHDSAYMALWWIPAGHIPTVEEAKERLDYLNVHGESDYVFTFRRIMAAPGGVVA